MKTKLFLLFLVVAVCVGINSCSSPLDVNTPRNRVIEDDLRIAPLSTQFKVIETGATSKLWEFIPDLATFDTLAQKTMLLDTSSANPMAWLRLSFKSALFPDVIGEASLYSMSFRVDSLNTHEPRILLGDPHREEGAMFVFAKRVNANKVIFDTVYTTSFREGASDGIFTVQLQHTPADSTMTAKFVMSVDKIQCEKWKDKGAVHATGEVKMKF